MHNTQTVSGCASNTLQYNITSKRLTNTLPDSSGTKSDITQQFNQFAQHFDRPPATPATTQNDLHATTRAGTKYTTSPTTLDTPWSRPGSNSISWQHFKLLRARSERFPDVPATFYQTVPSLRLPTHSPDPPQVHNRLINDSSIATQSTQLAASHASDDAERSECNHNRTHCRDDHYNDLTQSLD